MYSPNSATDAPPPKRMRLGTQSCAECRKRKVRCKFSPNAQVCDYCTSHDAQCTPQQPNGGHKVHPGPEHDLLQRVDDLQGIVKRICKAINLDVETASLADFEKSTTNALGLLRQAPTPESTSGNSTTGQHDEPDPKDQRDSADSSDDFNSFQNAPLLSLFDEVMRFETNDIRAGSGQLRLSVDQRIKSCVKSLKAFMPNEDGLHLILKTTERYWFIWKGFAKDQPASPHHLIDHNIMAARKFITDSMNSTCPTTVAKAILNLALCVQQLPKDFEYPKGDLPASPNALLDCFLEGAEILISSESYLGTLEGVECCLMYVKIYINMGKPRKAWLCGRRAIGLALLLDLQHSDESTDIHQHVIWSQLWQGDMILSLNLGVPYTSPRPYIDLSTNHTWKSTGEQVMHQLCVIAGHVIDRDQTRPTPEYSVTEQIEQELQLCRDGTDAEWWSSAPSAEMPLEAVYYLQVVKLQYFLVRKMLHLPGMLKSMTDRKYKKSRIAALEASRDLIKSYQGLRDNNRNSIIFCDLMDFHAFSAALTIIINLLSPSSQHGSQQVASDWKLVSEITATLQRVSEVLQCNVAAQATQLLKHFTAIHNGTYADPDGYEAVIPYFGKVRIRGARKIESQIEPRTESQHQTPDSPSFFSTTDFSANWFGSSFTGDFVSETELGVDWTAFPEIDGNYDWYQTYEAAQPWSA